MRIKFTLNISGMLVFFAAAISGLILIDNRYIWTGERENGTRPGENRTGVRSQLEGGCFFWLLTASIKLIYFSCDGRSEVSEVFLDAHALLSSFYFSYDWELRFEVFCSRLH